MLRILLNLAPDAPLPPTNRYNESMSEYLYAFQSSTAQPGFLRAPALAARPDARFVVAGVPWDGATTNRPGARFGPGEIRRASHMLCDGTHPLLGVAPVGHMADCGDLMLPNTSLEGMRAALAPQVAQLLKRHHMIWLGGDHSITLSLLRAYRAHFGRPLAMIHFDAHCDTWTSHFDEPSGHGTWVYEALNEQLIDPKLSIQIGIRSAAAPETANYVAGNKYMAAADRNRVDVEQGGKYVVVERKEGRNGTAALAEGADRAARDGVELGQGDLHRHARGSSCADECR